MYQNELKQGLNTVTEEGAIRSEESDLGNKKRKSLGEIYEETDRMLEMFWHLLNQGDSPEEATRMTSKMN